MTLWRFPPNSERDGVYAPRPSNGRTIRRVRHEHFKSPNTVSLATVPFLFHFSNENGVLSPLGGLPQIRLTVPQAGAPLLATEVSFALGKGVVLMF